MFDIGGPELILILVIALLVFGPRRLPAIGKQLGGFVGQMRASMRDFQGTLEREVALDEVREAGKAVGEIRSVATDAARDLSRGFAGLVHTAPALSSLPVPDAAASSAVGTGEATVPPAVAEAGPGVGGSSAPASGDGPGTGNAPGAPARGSDAPGSPAA